MKRSIDDTREKFDSVSSEYDDTRSEEHHRAVDLVVEWASALVEPDDTVVDLGAGTGMIALEVAPHVGRLIALDLSEEMLRELDRKAEERGIQNVETAIGRFREPEAERSIDGADVIVSNYAMHHLNAQEKQEAIDHMADLLERGRSDRGYVILGDVMLFEEVEEPEEHYDPDVDDPSPVEDLQRWFSDRGFSVEKVHRIAPATGVLALRYAGRPDDGQDD